MRVLFMIPFLACSIAAAQPYTPRLDYGQVLEPHGKILHGAGQDPGQIGGPGQNAFLNYWNVMEEVRQPIAYMYYEQLFNIGTDWAASLKQRLLPLGDRMIIIQFGLQLVGATEAIPAGELDEDIDDWLDGIEMLGLPVYARLGYEFNGLDWNGYLPEPYKASFIYLTEKIRARDLEIATVWNYVPDPTQPTDFMAYYPGDQYVDWWSINYFEPAQLTNALGASFLDSAEVHNRPVLIGESTPKDVGVLDGQADWDAWFAPFLNVLASEPAIKMTGYINWNWAEFPQWRTWGDARVEQNETVLRLLNEALRDSVYAHAGSEQEFRQLLGYSEIDPPGQVRGLSVSADSFPATVAWDAVSDDSGIARYKLYDEGTLIDFTKKTTVSFIHGEGGQEILLRIAAVDRAGNEGLPSDPIAFVLPENDGGNGGPGAGGELLTNGSFNRGLEGWSLTEFVPGVSGTLEVDTTGLMEGLNSAHVTITNNTGVNWHIQLEQPLRVKQHHRYAIAYQLRASSAAPMEMWFQKATAPFTGYAQRNIQLTTETQVFQDTASVPIDDDVFMRFMFGTSGLIEVWVDSVSVVDLGIDPAVASSVEDESPTQSAQLYAPFPNPVRTQGTISFLLPRAGSVRLNVFNALGQSVASLTDEYLAGGHHSVTWPTEMLTSGLYVVRLGFEGRAVTRPIIVIR